MFERLMLLTGFENRKVIEKEGERGRKEKRREREREIGKKEQRKRRKKGEKGGGILIALLTRKAG